MKLGFYEERDRQVVQQNSEFAARWLSRTLGGYEKALQLCCVPLEGEQWLPAQFDIPTATNFRHLHRYQLGLRQNLPKKQRDRELLLSNELLIIARRLRYRISVDHAGKPEDGRADLVFWTTPTTNQWISRTQMSLRSLVGELSEAVVGEWCEKDQAKWNCDDWGCVRLSDDPLRVVTVGPRSELASTHDDVASTLARAGEQLRVTRRRLRSAEGAFPLQQYAEELTNLAENPDLLNDVDVVLAYRGGGIRTFPAAAAQRPHERVALFRPQDREALLVAATELTSRGVEVVLGFGHGDFSALPPEGPLPIGLHEAITPTAAAQWIVREHVNNRLVDAEPDPGQRGIPDSATSRPGDPATLG